MVLRMDDVSSPRQHIVDGRLVVDDVPARVVLLPGEVELVAHHLLDTLDALLSGKRSSIRPISEVVLENWTGG